MPWDSTHQGIINLYLDTTPKDVSKTTQLKCTLKDELTKLSMLDDELVDRTERIASRRR